MTGRCILHFDPRTCQPVYKFCEPKGNVIWNTVICILYFSLFNTFISNCPIFYIYVYIIYVLKPSTNHCITACKVSSFKYGQSAINYVSIAEVIVNNIITVTLIEFYSVTPTSVIFAFGFIQIISHYSFIACLLKFTWVINVFF